jgi:hypothetical protein
MCKVNGKKAVEVNPRKNKSNRRWKSRKSEAITQLRENQIRNHTEKYIKALKKLDDLTQEARANKMVDITKRLYEIRTAFESNYTNIVLIEHEINSLSKTINMTVQDPKRNAIENMHKAMRAAVSMAAEHEKGKRV